jgi:hypothetical protein
MLPLEQLVVDVEKDRIFNKTEGRVFLLKVDLNCTTPIFLDHAKQALRIVVVSIVYVGFSVASASGVIHRSVSVHGYQELLRFLCALP